MICSSIIASRERNRTRSQQVAPEQQEQTLQVGRERSRIRREAETAEQREQMLQAIWETSRLRRETETPKQRAQRLHRQTACPQTVSIQCSLYKKPVKDQIFNSSLAGHTKNTYGVVSQLFVCWARILALPIRLQWSHASPQNFNYKDWLFLTRTMLLNQRSEKLMDEQLRAAVAVAVSMSFMEKFN